MAEADPIRVGVRELRERLGDYLRQAKGGSRILIVSRGKSVAELVAPSEPASSEAKPPRRLGALRGKVWMAEDWDEWPEGFIDAMVDGPIEPDP